MTYAYDTYGNRIWERYGTNVDDPNLPVKYNQLNLPEYVGDPNDPNDPNLASVTFSYDDDHNVLEDGGAKYTYDAENRLIEAIPAEDDPNNLTTDDKKLVFTYDYLNRRVRKEVYAWDPNEGASGDWSATAELDLRFMYHENLLLLELDGLDSNAKVRKYVWGLSQSPNGQGPANLGGLKRQGGANPGGPNSLLAIRDVAGSTKYVCFNNGTGSVAQLLDRSDASLDAAYVYDTRGDIVRNTGTYAADNPLRYQAMYFDSEFNYAGTSCDGLYCTADADYYSPRLTRPLTPLPSHSVAVAQGWLGALGDNQDPPVGPPAPLATSDNISIPPFVPDDDDDDDDDDDEDHEESPEEEESEYEICGDDQRLPENRSNAVSWSTSTWNCTGVLVARKRWNKVVSNTCSPGVEVNVNVGETIGYNQSVELGMNVGVEGSGLHVSTGVETSWATTVSTGCNFTCCQNSTGGGGQNCKVSQWQASWDLTLNYACRSRLGNGWLLRAGELTGTYTLPEFSCVVECDVCDCDLE